MTKIKFRKNSKIVNTVSKILLLFFLLSFGTVKNLSAQCPHTPKCVFDSCYYGGDGLSEATAFQIWSKAHLEELADSMNNSTVPLPNNWSSGKYFILMNDITDTVRTVIGRYNNNDRSRFSGHFDGNENKIVLGIEVTTAYNNNSMAGLFGIMYGGSIINPTVEGYVKIHSLPSGSVGYLGGFVGTTYGSNPIGTIIKNCTNNCILIAESIIWAAGGIVGSAANTKIQNCLNNGKILIYGSSSITINMVGGVGGIVGWLAYTFSTIENCINTGYIACANNDGGGVGGIVGVIHSGYTLINNINYGFVTGTNNVGGIIGELSSNSTISNNFNSGVVRGTSNVGCIVGKNNGGTLTNNHYDKQMCGAE